LGKPAPEKKLHQSGFKWSKRRWGGSGISWTIWYHLHLTTDI